MYETLWEPQKALFNRIESNWNHGDPVVVQAGQRGGKTTISKALLEKRQPKNAIVIAFSQEHAEAIYDDFPRWRGGKSRLSTLDKFALGHNQAATIWANLIAEGKLHKETLVIIEEAFWLPNGEALFDAYSSITPLVLSQSSKGPYRWKNRERIWRYATWDLNPTITRADLAPQYQQDPIAAARDFGNEEP